MSRMHHVSLSVVALAAAGGALAGCSSSGGTGASSAASSPTTAPVTTATTTRTTTTTPSTTTVNPGGSGSVAAGSASGSQCAESQLRASVANDKIAGVDAHVVKITFKNKSTSTCTLTGFPGAAIEDSSNHQVRQAKRVEGGPVGGTIEQHYGPVPLAPGATAFAYLEGESTREVGAAQAGCDGPGYPRILVTPPNTDTPVPFTIGWPQCYSFSVHPVREQ